MERQQQDFHKRLEGLAKNNCGNRNYLSEKFAKELRRAREAATKNTQNRHMAPSMSTVPCTQVLKSNLPKLPEVTKHREEEETPTSPKGKNGRYPNHPAEGESVGRSEQQNSAEESDAESPSRLRRRHAHSENLPPFEPKAEWTSTRINTLEELEEKVDFLNTQAQQLLRQLRREQGERERMSELYDEALDEVRRLRERPLGQEVEGAGRRGQGVEGGERFGQEVEGRGRRGREVEGEGRRGQEVEGGGRRGQEVEGEGRRGQEVEGRVKRLECERDEAFVKLRTAQIDNEELKMKLERMGEENKKEGRKWADKVTTLKNQLRATETDKDELARRQNRTLEMLNKMEIQLEEQKTKLAVLEEQKQEHLKRIENLGSFVNDLENTTKELEEKMDEKRHEIKEIKEKMKEMEDVFVKVNQYMEGGVAQYIEGVKERALQMQNDAYEALIRNQEIRAELKKAMKKKPSKN